MNKTFPSSPTVSVIIPAHDSIPEIRRCLQAILQTTPRPEEIIVIDDGGPKESQLPVESLGVKRIKNPITLGPAHARNQGALAATSSFACAATRRFARLPKGAFVRELSASGYPYTSLKLHGRTAELPLSDFNRPVIRFTRHTQQVH
jgi:glycosyltransferase involved in cell wall biosynthesis